MRLPSSLRIKQSRDYARVRSEGASFPGRYLVLSVLRGAVSSGFQFGLITPKRIGGAVVRNKIRRRLREIIRAHQERIAEGCHLVVIARWRSPETTLAGLEKDWLKLAARAGILKPPTHEP
jgi:ribonuclease P protein component